LASLPDRELRAGYAEMVKYGLLGDIAFFNWLDVNSSAVLALEPATIMRAIHTSCSAKARIVEADEREAGKRALLNLGHTFAHAFEAEAGYNGSLLHGEAVAAGMGLAFDLSVDLGYCSPDDAARCKAHLRAVGLPAGQTDLAAGNAAPSTLITHMRHDKKMRDGRMYFVLVNTIGDAFVSGDVPPDAVETLLKRGANAV
jgi:3-dehydroquinate synthetase